MSIFHGRDTVAPTDAIDDRPEENLAVRIGCARGEGEMRDDASHRGPQDMRFCTLEENNYPAADFTIDLRWGIVHMTTHPHTVTGCFLSDPQQHPADTIPSGGLT
jgi:hypothetical protein